MKIDPSTLGKFKKAYEEDFGEVLNDQEAFDCFTRLVNVLRIILPHDPAVHADTPRRE
jgi:hypothetical protein